MATGGEAELFEGLPELVSPERGGGRGAARLRMAERRQVELRAISLEDLVPADHRVRLVWRFVEGLDLSGFQQGGGGAARPSAGGPAHPGGFVAVRDDRGHRQRPCGGPPVRRAHRLSMAVRRRRHERQDAGRLPGRPRHAPGAPAGRQLHRLGPGWRRQPGPDRPGRRPGARIGRSRLVPPRLDPGGVPERGRAGGARPARRGQWRSGRAQPATSRGPSARRRRARAPGPRGAGRNPRTARPTGGKGASGG